jgi:hypothetical protein
LNAGIESAVVDDRILSVAGREQDFHVVSPFSSFVGQLPAVKWSGQTDIGEQQLYIRFARQQTQRGIPFVRFQHIVPELS